MSPKGDTTPADSAKGLRAAVDEIAKLRADLAAAGFIEPMTRHRGAEAGTDPPAVARKGREKTRAGILVQEPGPRAG